MDFGLAFRSIRRAMHLMWHGTPKLSPVRHPFILVLAVCVLVFAEAKAIDPEQSFFETRIRPLLAEHCLECHSHDTQPAPKAELYLDSREGILQGGETGPAAVPGQPADSLILRAVSYEDVDLSMPPKRRLKPEQIEDLRRWIEKGLVWAGPAQPPPERKSKGFDLKGRRDSHWSWQPLKPGAVPEVKQGDWPRNEIDHFILAKLEAKGLSPAPPASPAQWLRRVHLDVTGLPPSPEKLQSFLADSSWGAREAVVDRLLDSPQYGERWARHWMDLVRYAETMGHEFDYPIANAWYYRDYLIRALNQDVPYTRLVREHIAGDILPDPRLHPAQAINESPIGTLFYWLPQQKHSPVQLKLEQLDLIDNQIDVLSKSFLGMTIACARCHDHKFDAIATRDFYGLFSTLNSSRYTHAVLNAGPAFETALQQLSQAHEAAEKDALETYRKEVRRLPAYATRARQLLDEVASRPQESIEKVIVFEDFENPLSEDWLIEGNAFSRLPLQSSNIASYQGPLGQQGLGVINSHNQRVQDGKVEHSDRATGTLTSPEFQISHRYVHFLVGGGAHENQTCVQLLIDGKPVLSTTGRNANRMAPAVWDVSRWLGQAAKIRVVDQHSGGWGNIGVDHIVFSDQTTAGSQPSLVPSWNEWKETALAAGLDPSWLEKIGLAVASAEKDPQPDGWDTALLRMSEGSRPKLPPTPSETAPMEGTQVLADFVTMGSHGWRTDGQSFSHPVSDQVFLCRTDGGRLWPPGWWHSATQARELQGNLRSPTFTIDHPHVYVRVAGEGARVNLVIQNFTLIRNPIYGGLKHRIDQATPHWIRFDVSMWQGMQAYLEFGDTELRDPAGPDFPANGWIAARQVVASDSPREPADPDLQWPSPTRKVAQLSNHVSPASDSSLEWDRWILAGLNQNWFPALSETSPSMKKWKQAIRQLPTMILAPGMTEGSPLDGRVFVRGNPNLPGDEAPRHFLAALEDLSPGPIQSVSGRLEWAMGVTHPDNPLTWRVAVNRLWHHLFGRGIVPSVDDFGVLGQPPSHPELLDWLAGAFLKEGTSMKAGLRRMLLSSTYAMSSVTLDAMEKMDPANEWWHRMPIRRLDSEIIRDQILHASGRLDTRMFGSSVPIFLTDFMQGRGRPGKSGPLDGDGRRSIYVEVRRNFMSPMMLAFDAPQPFTTIGNRTDSNVPAQALILMNDPFVAGEAARLGQRMLELPGSVEEKVTQLFLRLFVRPPTATERDHAVRFLGSATLEDWSALCHTLFNLKEFIHVP